MKHKILILSALIIITAGLLFNACKESFLENNPIGPITSEVLANRNGVNGVLIGAYSLLDGLGGNVTEGFTRGISNWQYGEVASDNAHKGSTYSDQIEINPIENYSVLPTNGYMSGKWNCLYAGAQAANEVLRVLSKAEGEFSEEEANEIKAEAIFIRSVFLFEAAKMWRYVPYIDENVTVANDNFYVPNDQDILPLIEADLKWAVEHLNPVQGAIGRVNSWGAKALLGRVYLFELKFAEAKTILTDVIDNGVNSIGVKYDLVNFSDNFNPVKQNNAETVFSVQMSVNDGASGYNGNAADALNFPQGGPGGGCCGFFQPSFDLVNAYKTDPVTGLPLIDTYSDSDITSDQNVAPEQPFTPYTGTLDPRLDWTVGRRGIPLLDFGINPGSWVRSKPDAGPFIAMKNLYWKVDEETMTETYSSWRPHGATSNNYNMIRFADVLLMAAEAEVEAGSLDKAQEYVNRVRARAANPGGFVRTYKDPANPTGGFTDTPAANYFIKLYPAGYFAARAKEGARELVRFERRLELALEGHRFFDLQRWDKLQPGYMSNALNTYIDRELESFDYQILEGASFTINKNEIYPIPQSEIDNSEYNGVVTLKQNANY